jgi:tripartite-type tricarboxylate transporter receptor subunit TctC
MKRRTLILSSLTSLGLPAVARAQQTWPSRRIRIISPFAAGGGSDFVARFLAGHLSTSLGQPVVVENRAGAGGLLGTDLGAKSEPDGYTILISSNGPLAVQTALGGKMPYDAQKDLMPVSLLTKQPFVLLTHANHSAKNLEAFLQQARARPESMHFGTVGHASAPHLAIEMMSMQAGIKMTHVPYKGGAAALTDLAAGQIQLATADPNTARPLLGQGRVRALAVTTARRSPLLPDIPTVAEAGVPGYEVSGWFGALVPAGTPAAIVQRLNAELVRIMATEEAQRTLGALGGEVMATTPAQFAEHISAEIVRWRDLVNRMNLRVKA